VAAVSKRNLPVGACPEKLLSKGSGQIVGENLNEPEGRQDLEGGRL